MMLFGLVVFCVLLLLFPYLPAMWETRRREAQDRARSQAAPPPAPPEA